MGSAGLASLAPFELPAVRHATEPPEARGLRRDEVRLLVSHLDPDAHAGASVAHVDARHPRTDARVAHADAEAGANVGGGGGAGSGGARGPHVDAEAGANAGAAAGRGGAGAGARADAGGARAGADADAGDAVPLNEHLRFDALPRVLRAGDLLVVNASGTLNASLEARLSDRTRVELHLSTELPGGLRTVEVRALGASGTTPFRAPLAGETLHLPGRGHATLLAPYPFSGDLAAPSRLWAAALELPMPLGAYLQRYGSPIRYGYVPRSWPLDAYQTVFATEMGSAEMPSAGRPFTRDLVSTLFAAGVAIAPIVLHTGVSSLEDHEPPYEERFCVPRRTADRVNRAHAEGHRVIAVGTTVVRALETVTDDTRVTHPGEGWTSFVVSPDYDLRAVDGLITGLHEPRATHLAIIQAVARRSLAAAEAKAVIDQAYREALDRGYLWHEFGDTHLMLPTRV